MRFGTIGLAVISLFNIQILTAFWEECTERDYLAANSHIVTQYHLREGIQTPSKEAEEPKELHIEPELEGEIYTETD